MGVGFAKVEAADPRWRGRVDWVAHRREQRCSISGPPGTSDADRRVDGGRPRVTVCVDDPEASARVSAVADAIAGMLASPQSPIPVETSVVPINDDDVAAEFVDLDRLRADRDLFPFAATALTNVSAQPGALPPVLDRLDVVLRDGDAEITGLLPGRYLSFAEREEIAIQLAGGCGVREIAPDRPVAVDDLEGAAPQRRDAKRRL